MPISAPSNNGPAGFTLIEMLVVLSILGLLAAIMAQNIGRRSGGVARQEATAMLASAIETERQEAIRSGAIRSVDPAKFIQGAIFAPTLPTPPNLSGLVLHPDGSTNGGTISLGSQRLLSVDWLTGEVRGAS